MYSRLVLLTLALISFCGALRQQAVAIKGKLLCGTVPARNVRVKLWEEDSGKILCGSNPAANVRVKLWDEDSGPDPDDLLDQGYTDAQGMFDLKGDTAELTTIDPVFKIYHDCDDGVKPGQRKVKFRIPSSYVSEGKVAKKTFDIGILNLETIFPGEEREILTSRMRRHHHLFEYADIRPHKRE